LRFRALRGVVGVYAWSLGLIHGRWAVRVVVWSAASSFVSEPGSWCAGVVHRDGNREEGGQWWRRKRENGPRQKSWPVFVTHRVGLPLHGSPLVFPPSCTPGQGDWKRPTSL